MSRKPRRSKQQPHVEPSSGVPDELLAEGSGPHGDVVPVLAAEVEVVEIIENVDLTEDVELEAAGATEATEADESSLEAAPAEELGEPAPDQTLEAAGADGAEGVDGEIDPEADDAEVGPATLPTSAASMDAVQLKQLVEALIFASDKPITVQRLRQLTRVSDIKRLEQTLAEIATDYEHRGLILQQVSGGFQFRTRPQFSVWVQQLIQGRPVRLSRAQLETLAIIAYRQPITRPEIDDIRGVDSSATLKLLMDRLLIRVLGKKEEVGRPMLYGTTKEFLDFFSLGDLRELPTLREYSELSDESRKVMTARLGIGPDGSGGSNDDGSSGGGSGGGGSGPMGGGSSDGDDGDLNDASALSDAASDVFADAAHEQDVMAEAAVDESSAADLLATDDVASAADLVATDDEASDPDLVATNDEASETELLADAAEEASDTGLVADASDEEPSASELVAEANETALVADAAEDGVSEHDLIGADAGGATADADLVAGAIDAAYATYADHLTDRDAGEHEVDATPGELFAQGSAGAELAADDGTPESMFAAGTASNLAAIPDDESGPIEDSDAIDPLVPTDMIASEAELPTDPVTE